jgi:hypothetical protein
MDIYEEMGERARTGDTDNGQLAADTRQLVATMHADFDRIETAHAQLRMDASIESTAAVQKRDGERRTQNGAPILQVKTDSIAITDSSVHQSTNGHSVEGWLRKPC